MGAPCSLESDDLTITGCERTRTVILRTPRTGESFSIASGDGIRALPVMGGAVALVVEVMVPSEGDDGGVDRAPAPLSQRSSQ